MGLIAVGGRAGWALEKFSIGITKFNGDVSEFLAEVANGLHFKIAQKDFNLHWCQRRHEQVLICRVRHVQ